MLILYFILRADELAVIEALSRFLMLGSIFWGARPPPSSSATVQSSTNWRLGVAETGLPPKTFSPLKSNWIRYS